MRVVRGVVVIRVDIDDTASESNMTIEEDEVKVAIDNNIVDREVAEN